MRKYLLLITSLLLFIGLAACGSNDNNNEENNENLPINENENNEPAGETNNDPADENGEENNVNDSSDNNNESDGDDEEAAHSELDEFDEGEIIQSQIEVESLSMTIETDNDNKRVILFKDGNQAQYKTVYVKHDKHLKIINIKEDEGLLFEGKIE